MSDHWPTKEELLKAQFDENTRAMEQDDEPDPICECGQPGYACCCNCLAEKLGYWADGTEWNWKE
ncbi:hypothetical protein A2Z67_04045 [Candidatus Woesebacteria bacterium RBG_13_36_22]|uniref:Uncharacterized protein n=1 Tax=Candidatus Woesebacteria bacterium RBG_13_36_22 TaxID=1802478 RepID=A0A1F7X6D5_9BACT|nr:MAG: hypothetical protein A2Z67_04045 [Candidatus Woesebacteria bacterium RBG_13_36_22]